MIIGLTGFSGSGKSTIAKKIVRKLGKQNTTKISFADTVKSQFARDTRVSHQLLHTIKAKNYYREQLSEFSEQYKKEHGPLVFFNRTLELINENLAQNKTIVIDDVRYKNEIDFLLENNNPIFLVHPMFQEFRHIKEPEKTLNWQKYEQKMQVVTNRNAEGVADEIISLTEFDL